jgi:ABC-type phosphate transport system substrate-binding protein
MAKWIALGMMILICSSTGIVSAESCVIVNKKNPVNDISAVKLAQIYKGMASFWPDGKKITPVEMSNTHPLAVEFTQKVLRMSLEMKQKMWVTKIYSGQATPPRHFKETNEVLSFVASEPGAIGYVGKEELTDAVKCISVGGKSGL